MYKYKPHITPGPYGHSVCFVNSDDGEATEVAELDGWRYVHVPEGVTLPEQPVEIDWQAVELTPELREELKAVSPACNFIHQQMQVKIRERYPVEEEQYFARIGVGVALGAYTFQAGEQAALLEFGAHVEAVRQWGRAQRALIGL